MTIAQHSYAPRRPYMDAELPFTTWWITSNRAYNTDGFESVVLHAFVPRGCTAKNAMRIETQLKRHAREIVKHLNIPQSLRSFEASLYPYRSGGELDFAADLELRIYLDCPVAIINAHQDLFK